MTVHLAINTINTITQSSNGDLITRSFIPTELPHSKVTGLDVSKLDDVETTLLCNSYSEFMEYRDLARSRLFDFKTWLEHTSSDIDQSKFDSITVDVTDIV